jgi:hypothetical protein
MATRRQRRNHILKIARKKMRRLFQFGQNNDSKAGGGAWACGHVSLQIVYKAWFPNKRTPSINRIETLAGPRADPDNNGIHEREMLKAANRLGLKYRLVYDMSPADVVRVAKERGPVIFLCIYTRWPEWHGYKYRGATGNFRPNGIARPKGKAGKNQLVGFNGGHWSVVLSAQRVEDQELLYVRDTNHASPARPERPAYDIMTKQQWTRMYMDYRRQRGRVAVLVPTGRLNP